MAIKNKFLFFGKFLKIFENFLFYPLERPVIWMSVLGATCSFLSIFRQFLMINVTGLLLPIIRTYWSYCALVLASALAWHFDARAVVNADALRTQATHFKEAQAAAAAIAQRALQHEQAISKAKAQETEHAYKVQLLAAQSAADQYIAAHRLRHKAIASGASRAAATPKDHGAEIPVGLPANAVVVSTGDVQACTDAVTYAIMAHNWANTINR